VSLSTKEIRVVNAEETSDHWDIFLERSSAKVSVHCMSTAQKLMEVFVSNMKCYTEANCRPNRVSASNPALKSKHVFGINTEFGNFCLVGRERDEVFSNIALAFGLFQEPRFGAVSIGDCFGSSKGLGCYKNESCFRIRVCKGLGHVSSIDVGNKVESLFAIAIEFESFCDHYWATISTSVTALR